MEKHHVCPWWMGYLLLIPLRKYGQNPQKILGKYLHPGMKVIDFGSAMGYFSLPMAKMVNPSGKVYCFDIQQKMLDKLMKRVRSAGLEQCVELRNVNSGSAFDGLDSNIDFVLLFAVAHEVPDQHQLFRQLYATLKPGAIMLFAEPAGHVSTSQFNQSVALAIDNGFEKQGNVMIKQSHAILMLKP